VAHVQRSSRALPHGDALCARVQVVFRSTTRCPVSGAPCTWMAPSTTRQPVPTR